MRTHADVCWRIDMHAQAESRALLAKDALQDTLDALRQKMAVQELEHAEAERRWREERMLTYADAC